MIKKVVFYILLLMDNAIALGLIGISFLAGPGPSKETEAELYVRIMSYFALVGVVFSLISFLICFVFRDALSFSRKALVLVPIIELMFFLTVAVVAFSFVYGIS